MFCSTSKYEGERMKESLPEVGDLHLSSGAADASLPSQRPVETNKSKPNSLADIYAINIT